MLRYGIKSGNVHNMDEKGILSGIDGKTEKVG